MRKSEKSWNETLVKRDVLDLFKLIKCVFKSMTENALPEEYYSVCAQRQNRTCLSTLPFSPCMGLYPNVDRYGQNTT